MSDDAIASQGAGQAADDGTAAPDGPARQPRRERALAIPALALVALVGASGSGKSTFAARHFKPTEILSSDAYRAIVGDDPNDQRVTNAAFDALHYIAGLRLTLGRLTVVDATNVKPQDRAQLIHLAREHDVLPVAIVLNLDERICRERNASRADRQFGAHVTRNHVLALRRSLRGLAREGFRYVYILNTPDEVEGARIEYTQLYTDRRSDTGPFDIIGDAHGCYDELIELLTTLGYQPDAAAGMRHPDGRRAIFVGDLVDRGPQVVETVRLVMRMVAAGQALCVPGNHDTKLQRALAGRNVQVTHGLGESLAQIAALPDDERAAFSRDYRAFADGLISHYVLDAGRLVVAHAGMKEAYQGRASGRVREFALYGETTGETDEFGLPVRANWAADYRGSAAVVYGHTPVPNATWLNNTIDIDTGCVFGGRLTALRWPERELVSVPAHAVYAEPKRPLSSTTNVADDTLLRIEDALGKQIIPTRLTGDVIVEADRTAAALEVMSRFALDPRWLIYLPPTMSPCETATAPGWLEYPTEAFAYYRQTLAQPRPTDGVADAAGDGEQREPSGQREQPAPIVVCEEKHMGSRAVLALCRDGATAARRFGVEPDGPSGVCYTRTGRRFFDDDTLDRALIARLTDALTASNFWDRFETDWVCLDAELLPWSAKAQGLLRAQYAPVGAAGEASLRADLAAVEAALARSGEGGAMPQLAALQERLRAQQTDMARYREAYRRYCWETQGLDGVRIAPFHLLATEGKTWFDRDHLWHMTELARLAEADPALLLATQYRAVNLNDAEACAAATDWWEELTSNGGEGMVVKPLNFIARGARGLTQPAVKCRGREYLRIIYGPDYTTPENLTRLRKRGLSTKRNLALREFSLGVEALERFIRHEPLYRTHQAVFGVLALESEPVDPRL